MTLFQLNSAEDLLCRGFGREEIQARINVDVGYNGNAFKSAIAGVDRTEYKFEFVRARVTRAEFVTLLTEYGDRMRSKGELFAACGLADSVRISLKTLAERMDCVLEYADAHRRECDGRDAVRRQTNRNRFGVDYPAQCSEFVERARETTVRRYGGIGMASPEIRDKMERTMTERYGSVENAMAQVHAKVKVTNAAKRAARPSKPKPVRKKAVSVGRVWRNGDSLFDADSLDDLFCRGFSGAQILEKTGVDLGHNCYRLQLSISKPDRVNYATRVVKERVGLDVFWKVFVGSVTGSCRRWVCIVHLDSGTTCVCH